MIRTTSRIIYVDVVVRDSAGRIVHGLTQQDFRVMEDKQVEDITYFAAHAGATKPLVAAPPLEISNVLSGGRDMVLNIVLLDLMDTSPQDQGYARKRMIEFLTKLPPGHPVALFVLSDRLHLIQGFNTDSAALVSAANSIDIKQLNRLRPVGQQIADLDISAYFDRNATLPSSGEALQHSLVAEDAINMKQRLDGTAIAFQQIMRAVNGYPGRKNLYWLAGQFPSSDYYRLGATSATTIPLIGAGGVRRENARAVQDQRNASLGVPGIGLESFEEQTDRILADSQIAVYPISLVGVQTDSVGGDQSGLGTAGDPNAQSAAASSFFFERQTGRAVMDGIADRTGGEAFYGNNDLAALLERGFEDGENYYELAYQPKNNTWDGKFRSINVSVKASGSRLSYRRGYYATPDKPAGDVMAVFASSMRIETPPATQLTIRAKSPTVTAGRVQWSVRLDPTGIDFSQDANGDRRAKVQIVTMAYPVEKQGEVAQTNAVMKLGLTETDYREVLTGGIPFQQTLALKPGRYALRLGVVDLVGGRIGTLTVPLTVPPS